MVSANTRLLYCGKRIQELEKRSLALVEKNSEQNAVIEGLRELAGFRAQHQQTILAHGTDHERIKELEDLSLTLVNRICDLGHEITALEEKMAPVPELLFKTWKRIREEGRSPTLED